MQNQNEVSFHIKSAKTRKEKDGRVCDVAFKRITNRPNGKISISDVNEAGHDLIHPDMQKALKAFIPHFLLQSEKINVNELQPSYFKKKEFLKDTSGYEVTGIHIKEAKDKQFVIMVGRQNLKTGRVISMTLPMLCFDPHEDDEDAYPFHKELKQAVEGYLVEVEHYLSGDKLGQPDQTEIPFAKKEEPVKEEKEEPEPEGDALDQVIADKKKGRSLKVS